LVTTWFVLRRLKQQILWQRWYTWLAISILFGSSYLLDAFVFRGLVLALGMVMLFEFCRLMKYFDAITAFLMMIVFQHYFDVFLGFSPAGINLVIFVPALIISGYLFKASKLWITPVTFFGVLLIGLVWPLLVLQPDKTLALLLTVACFDVASFAGGTLFGKSGKLSLKLFPKTSPNKTLAGLLSGILAVALVLFLFNRFNPISLLLLITGAVLGDYLESKVKRFAEVKDAGNWLPGFGGLLDRFDSLILVAPLAVIIF